MDRDREITNLLLAWGAGDQEALARLMSLVYDELHHLAAHHMRRERFSHTLQPTALVHEAYTQLIDQHRVEWSSRVQFYGITALMMRRTLLKHARHHRAVKRTPAITAPSSAIGGKPRCPSTTRLRSWCSSRRKT